MSTGKNLRKPGGTQFGGPVTLRRGGSRTILNKTYIPGTAYAPDDEGVQARPLFFILAHPDVAAAVQSDLVPVVQEEPAREPLEDEDAVAPEED